jgi:hypothetical protein
MSNGCGRFANKQEVMDATLPTDTESDRRRRVLAEKVETIMTIRGLTRPDAEREAKTKRRPPAADRRAAPWMAHNPLGPRPCAQSPHVSPLINTRRQVQHRRVSLERSAPRWLIGWTLPLAEMSLIAGLATSEFKFSATMRASP